MPRAAKAAARTSPPIQNWREVIASDGLLIRVSDGCWGLASLFSSPRFVISVELQGNRAQGAEMMTEDAKFALGF
jgi:hypothetical protein